MLRLSDIVPRTAIHLVAMMAIVAVLWSGAGVNWWMAAVCEKTHLVTPLEQNDGEPQEDHQHKDHQQDAKILNCMERSECTWSASLACSLAEVVRFSLHHPDVLTPPPEC